MKDLPPMYQSNTRMPKEPRRLAGRGRRVRAVKVLTDSDTRALSLSLFLFYFFLSCLFFSFQGGPSLPWGQSSTWCQYVVHIPTHSVEHGLFAGPCALEGWKENSRALGRGPVPSSPQERKTVVGSHKWVPKTRGCYCVGRPLTPADSRMERTLWSGLAALRALLAERKEA